MAGILTVSIAAIITIFWKISAHTSVFSGVCGVLIENNAISLLGAIALLILLLIAFSRVYLQEHTIAQVILGSCLGGGVAYFVHFIF